VVQPKTADGGSRRGQVLFALIPLLIILFPLGHSIVGRVIPRGSDTSEPFLERPDAKYDRCVKETSYMRYHHWELLREIREEVVRYGKRGDIGLDGCRKCHTSKERFCNQCHNAVSLTPDCFGCHYYP
jgi:hypothetical protein